MEYNTEAKKMEYRMKMTTTEGIGARRTRATTSPMYTTAEAAMKAKSRLVGPSAI